MCLWSWNSTIKFLKLLSLSKSIAGIFTVTTVSFATWGAVEANSTYNKNQYKKKIKDYEEWRETFYEKKLYDGYLMCSSTNIEICLNEKNIDKEYLPSPYEDNLWEKAYKSYLIDNYQKNPKNIKNSEDWRNYCYKEVKTAIDKEDVNYFDVSEYKKNDKYHNRCVLNGRELKK